MVRKSDNYYNRPIEESEWNRIMNIWSMNPEEKELIIKNKNESIAIAEKIIAKKINLVLFVITGPWLIVVLAVIIYFVLKINSPFLLPVFIVFLLMAIISQQYFQRKNIQTYYKILQIEGEYNITAFDATLILVND